MSIREVCKFNRYGDVFIKCLIKDGDGFLDLILKEENDDAMLSWFKCSPDGWKKTFLNAVFKYSDEKKTIKHGALVVLQYSYASQSKALISLYKSGILIHEDIKYIFIHKDLMHLKNSMYNKIFDNTLAEIENVVLKESFFKTPTNKNNKTL